MATKLINSFRGYRFIPSVSDDSVLCYYHDESFFEMSAYVFYKGVYYSYGSCFLDAAYNSLVVIYKRTTTPLKSILEIAPEVDSTYLIEVLK